MTERLVPLLALCLCSLWPSMAHPARQQRDRDPASAATSVPAKAHLVKRGEVWILRIATTPDIQALARASGKKTPRVTVPLFLRKGRWLAGTLGADGWVETPLAENDLASIDPGPNFVTVQAPGWREDRIRFDAGPLFEGEADLAALAAAKLRPVPAARKEPRFVPSVDCAGVLFDGTAPVVSLVGNQGPVFRDIPLGARARKLYLRFQSGIRLEGLRLSLRTADGRMLFPAPTLCGSVIVLDLGEIETLEALTMEVTGGGTATLSGITALSHLRAGTFAHFSPRAQRIAAQEPLPLFAFDKPTLQGWEIRGKGWGTTDTVGEPFQRKGVSRYFADSKADGGEPATGTILSPPFTILGSALTFLANGHSGKNYYALVDAASEKELRRSPVPEKTGPFEKIGWDVQDLRGRKVRFMAVDEDTRTGYAWLAFDDITLEP